MKKILCCLGTSLMAISGFATVPAMVNCKCQDCSCTQEMHCGCLAKSSSQKCQCGDNCQCGDKCSCK